MQDFRNLKGKGNAKREEPLKNKENNWNNGKPSYHLIQIHHKTSNLNLRSQRHT